MTILAPDVSFSDKPTDSSIFLSTLPYDKPEAEEPISVTYSEPSDSPRSEPSSLLETSSSEMPSEEPPEPTFPY